MFDQQWGALTVSGREAASPIRGVSIADVDIEDSTFAGLLFVGPADAIADVSLTNVTIARPGTYGLVVAPKTSGSATTTNVVVTSAASGGLQNGSATTWTFARESGNAGW